MLSPSCVCLACFCYSLGTIVRREQPVLYCGNRRQLRSENNITMEELNPSRPQYTEYVGVDVDSIPCLYSYSPGRAHLFICGNSPLTIFVFIGSNFSKKIENHVVGTDLGIRFGLVADDTSGSSDTHDVVHDCNTITINKVIICFM